MIELKVIVELVLKVTCPEIVELVLKVNCQEIVELVLKVTCPEIVKLVLKVTLTCPQVGLRHLDQAQVHRSLFWTTSPERKCVK